MGKKKFSLFLRVARGWIQSTGTCKLDLITLSYATIVQRILLDDHHLLPGGGKRLINGHHTSTAVDSLTQKRESVLPKTEDQSLVTTSKSRLYVHQLISMCIDSNKRLSLESSVNEQIASQHLEHCFERTYSPLVSPTRDLGIGESD
jgi:hypothetical protein